MKKINWTAIASLVLGLPGGLYGWKRIFNHMTSNTMLIVLQISSICSIIFATIFIGYWIIYLAKRIINKTKKSNPILEFAKRESEKNYNNLMNQKRKLEEEIEEWEKELESIPERDIPEEEKRKWQYKLHSKIDYNKKEIDRINNQLGIKTPA
jgi:peptidoglycan hydrolase CwlO-like protein